MGTPNTIGDAVVVQTATTGTGTYSLGTGVTGYLTFAQGGVGSGARVCYTVVDSLQSPTVREIGEGIYTAGSPGTLTRARIVRNTTGGTSAVNWGSGTKYVFLSVNASRTPVLDTDGKLIASVIPDQVGTRLVSGLAQSVPHNVITAASFNQQQDTSMGQNLGLPATIITIPESGYYSVLGRIGFHSASTTGNRGGYLLVGGSTVIADVRPALSGDRTYVGIADQNYYSAGTELQFGLFQTSGAALNAGGSPNAQDFFSVRRLRG